MSKRNLVTPAEHTWKEEKSRKIREAFRKSPLLSMCPIGHVRFRFPARKISREELAKSEGLRMEFNSNVICTSARGLIALRRDGSGYRVLSGGKSDEIAQQADVAVRLKGELLSYYADVLYVEEISNDK